MGVEEMNKMSQETLRAEAFTPHWEETTIQGACTSTGSPRQSREQSDWRYPQCSMPCLVLVFTDTVLRVVGFQWSTPGWSAAQAQETAQQDGCRRGTGWLQQQTLLLLLDAGSLRSRCWQIQCFLRARFVVCRELSSPRRGEREEENSMEPLCIRPLIPS